MQLSLPAGTRVTLKEDRNYDPTSIHQYLYRMAESQFLRMLKQHGGTSTITQIDYYVHPHLEQAFMAKKQEYDNLFGVGNHEVRLGFHGTAQAHIGAILQSGFTLTKVGSTTDSGTLAYRTSSAEAIWGEVKAGVSPFL